MRIVLSRRACVLALELRDERTDRVGSVTEITRGSDDTTNGMADPSTNGPTDTPAPAADGTPTGGGPIFDVPSGETESVHPLLGTAAASRRASFDRGSG